MKKNKIIKYIWIVPTSCLIFFLLIFFSNGFIYTINDYTVIPMQKGINCIGLSLSNYIDNYSYRQELLEENEVLKNQIENLKIENFFLLKEKGDLKDLRKLHDVDELYPDYEKIGAQVIYKDSSSSLYNTFVINKGSRDGMAVNMNVIANGGLVGIITEVGTNWSSVRSIIDNNCRVGAQISSTSDKCITMGNIDLMTEKGVMTFNTLKYIKSDIKEGDQIVTSSISSKYLEGILIGYINNITLDSSQIAFTGQFTPAVDFSNIQNVLVITDLK